MTGFPGNNFNGKLNRGGGWEPKSQACKAKPRTIPEFAAVTQARTQTTHELHHTPSLHLHHEFQTIGLRPEAALKPSTHSRSETLNPNTHTHTHLSMLNLFPTLFKLTCPGLCLGFFQEPKAPPIKSLFLRRLGPVFKECRLWEQLRMGGCMHSEAQFRWLRAVLYRENHQYHFEVCLKYTVLYSYTRNIGL